MKRKWWIFVATAGAGLGITVPFIQNADALSVPKNWMWSAAWFVAKKADTATYNVAAGVTKGSYGETTTPGTIYFNHGKTGGAATFYVKSLSKNHSLAMVSQASLLNWGGKITVVVTNPKGGTTVNKTLTRGQYKGFQFGLTGKYTVRFIENSAEKWTPYVSYRYDNANKVYSLENVFGANHVFADDSDQAPEVNLAPLDTDEAQELETVADKLNTDEVDTVAADGIGQVLAPSWGESVDDSAERILSFSDYANQFSDEGAIVMSMKGYEVGQKVTVQDEISSVDYDEESNETTFKFSSLSSDDDNNGIKFAGDLTDQYHVGDSLKLRFTVVGLSDDSDDLRIPNLYKYEIDHDGAVPTIDDYVVK